MLWKGAARGGVILCAVLWLPLCAGQRRAVIVDIDGVRRDTFEQTYREGRLPNFQRILETALWFDNATAVIPSETLIGQASIFTGVDPSRHGIVGNTWFDREAERLVDYVSPAGAACVFGFTLFGSECRGGLANRHLLAPTLYEAASAAGLSSLVAFNHYWKGATEAVPLGLADALSFIQGEAIDYEAFDRRMMDRVLEALAERGLPAILTVYFAGTDGVGHTLGTAGQPRYLERVIDPELGRLLDALAWLDPEWSARTLFIITSDHGRTDAVLNPEDLTIAADLQAALARAGFEAERARVAANGGTAYIYLKGASWTQPPPEEEVRAALRELSEDPLLERVVDSLRLRSPEDSPRAGDILVTLKPDHYFGNHGAGSHHGSIWVPDLAVPLILAQGGLRAGHFAERVRNTQVARSIADYLGFSIEGADAGLPVSWPSRKALPYPSATSSKLIRAVKASTAGRRSP